MKLFVILFALIGAIAAAPQLSRDLTRLRVPGRSNRDYSNIKIIEYEFQNHEDGGYHFHYLQDDGQARTETGTLVTEDKVDENGNAVIGADGQPEKVSWISVEGSYSYIDIDDGSRIQVDYKGDKGGFQQTTTRHGGDSVHRDEEAGGSEGGAGGGSPLPLPPLPIPIPGLGGRRV